MDLKVSSIHAGQSPLLGYLRATGTGCQNARTAATSDRVQPLWLTIFCLAPMNFHLKDVGGRGLTGPSTKRITSSSSGTSQDAYSVWLALSISLDAALKCWSFAYQNNPEFIRKRKIWEVVADTICAILSACISCQLPLIPPNDRVSLNYKVAFIAIKYINCLTKREIFH